MINHKMRLIVRRDLSPEQRIIQCVHAAVELTAGMDQKDPGFADWVERHKSVVLFGVHDEDELLKWRARLVDGGFCFRIFQESHTGEHTAIAVHPVADSRFFHGLSLL